MSSTSVPPSKARSRSERGLALLFGEASASATSWKSARFGVSSSSKKRCKTDMSGRHRRDEFVSQNPTRRHRACPWYSAGVSQFKLYIGASPSQPRVSRRASPEGTGEPAQSVQRSQPRVYNGASPECTTEPAQSVQRSQPRVYNGASPECTTEPAQSVQRSQPRVYNGDNEGGSVVQLGRSVQRSHPSCKPGSVALCTAPSLTETTPPGQPSKSPQCTTKPGVPSQGGGSVREGWLRCTVGPNCTTKPGVWGTRVSLYSWAQLYNETLGFGHVYNERRGMC